MFVKIHFDDEGLIIEDLDESSSGSSDSDSSSDDGNNRPGDLPREPPRPPDAPRPPPRAPPNQPGGAPPIDPDRRRPPQGPVPRPPGGPPPNQRAERINMLRQIINENNLQEILGNDEELLNQMADGDWSEDSMDTVLSSSSDDEDNQPKPPRNAQPVIAVRAVQTRHKEPLYEPQPITINNNAAPINIGAPAINVQPPVVNVEGARLNVEAPRVNVEAPRVNVEAPQIQVNVPAPQIQVNVPPPQIIHQETNIEQILIAIREELNSNLHLPYSNDPQNNLLMEENNGRGPPPNPGAGAIMERPTVLHEPDQVQQATNNTQPPQPPAPPAPPAPVAQPEPVVDTGDIEAVLTAMEEEVNEDKNKGWHNWSDDPASISMNMEPSSVEPAFSMDSNPVFNSDSMAYLTSLDPDLDSRGNYTDASVEKSNKRRRVEWRKYTKNAKMLHYLIADTLRRRKQIGNTTKSGKYITKRGHDYLNAIIQGYWLRLRNMPVYTREQLRPDGLPIDYDQRRFIIDMINLTDSLPENSTSRLKEKLQHQLDRILPHLKS